MDALDPRLPFVICPFPISFRGGAEFCLREPEKLELAVPGGFIVVGYLKCVGFIGNNSGLLGSTG